MSSRVGQQSPKSGRNTGEKPIIYLACPYTHKNPTIRLRRFELVTAAAATLVRRGLVVFSPITMTHPMDVALAGNNTLGSDFWIKFDETFMDKCSEIIILQLEGWEKSSGIQREIEFFRKAEKPISFMLESDIDLSCVSDGDNNEGARERDQRQSRQNT